VGTNWPLPAIALLTFTFYILTFTFYISMALGAFEAAIPDQASMTGADVSLETKLFALPHPPTLNEIPKK